MATTKNEVEEKVVVPSTAVMPVTQIARHTAAEKDTVQVQAMATNSGNAIRDWE